MKTKSLGKLSFTYHDKFKNNFEIRMGHSIFITKRRALSLLKFLLENMELTFKQRKELEAILEKRSIDYIRKKVAKAK